MGNRGRFGKYGEVKRLRRLRTARRGFAPAGSLQSRGGGFRRFFSGKGDTACAITIRNALAVDRAFITSLSDKVFTVYGPYEETIGDWFASGAAVTLTAVMGKRPVGFAMLGHILSQNHTTDRFELLAVAVDPGVHRMGVGRLLLEKIEKKAVELRIKHLFLHTAAENLAAQGLFTKAGYRLFETRNKFYPNGQDALTMVKDLPS